MVNRISANSFMDRYRWITPLIAPAVTMLIAFWLAMGFGFITPARTASQLRGTVDTLRAQVTVNRAERLTYEAETSRAVHALLVMGCLNSKPNVIDRVHVACDAVMRAGAIQ